MTKDLVRQHRLFKDRPSVWNHGQYQYPSQPGFQRRLQARRNFSIASDDGRCSIVSPTSMTRYPKLYT